jgi:hypothetical protein
VLPQRCGVHPQTWQVALYNMAKQDSLGGLQTSSHNLASPTHTNVPAAKQAEALEASITSSEVLLRAVPREVSEAGPQGFKFR